MIDFDHIIRTLSFVPRVSQSVIDQRREAMTLLLRDRAYLPVNELCRRFRISEATARRDLDALSRQRSVVRTFGGALADYDRRFAPFADRLKIAAPAKARIARRAVEMIEPGMTVFLDAGTTLYTLAGLLAKEPPATLTIVTNSLAVAEKLARIEQMEVNLTGGTLLPNQSVLLGDAACKSANLYQFDLAFLGAEACDGTGVWNSAANVVELQRAVIARSARHAVCIDARKFGHTAPTKLMTWTEVDLLITDAPADEARAAGVVVDKDRCLTA
jgi:DeoR/GlpR family transcriptional regulator of sugar metabolism